MSTQEPGRASPSAALTSLPRLEDLPRTAGGGFDEEKVREAFDAFRRHALQLQAQLRVLQAAGKGAHVDATGHAVRMDALHLIRAAAEFADALERDATNASAAQLGRTEEEVRHRQNELQQREAEINRFREESERQRAEILAAAKNEARDVVGKASEESNRELREAEGRAARLLEQSRHNATELTNAARAEVEQTLEWARAQAGAVMARAQQGAEQLLAAAGLGADQLHEVSSAIVRAAEASLESSRGRREAAHAPEPPRPAAQEPEPERGHVEETRPEAPIEDTPVPPSVSPPVTGPSAAEGAEEAFPEAGRDDAEDAGPDDRPAHD
jgi:F0F1-type ATP synthase membrane subunit b/b'